MRVFVFSGRPCGTPEEIEQCYETRMNTSFCQCGLRSFPPPVPPPFSAYFLSKGNSHRRCSPHCPHHQHQIMAARSVPRSKTPRTAAGCRFLFSDTFRRAAGANLQKRHNLLTAPDKKKKPHGGLRSGHVDQPGGCMNGISAFAAFTRTRSGAAVWLTSACSHSSGSAVSGRPPIRRGLLRAPGGLPAPLR